MVKIMEKYNLHPNSLRNLRPATSESGRIMGQRGGKVITDRRKWSKRKYCKDDCPYSSTCPFLSASRSSPARLCALKAKKVISGDREVLIQPDIIESFFSLFDKRGEALLKETLKSVFLIRLQTNNDSIDELYKYVHVLVAVKKTFYGEG